ncbi:hypothetical protein E1B28_005018 [Marasmius oreades]|uniref:CxC2-like cysteine cluster KDZ transposase-associated domain-containing protein n=1 Tax=Marasmius oreades TaxID=181124 RepID=A0A9P8ADP6_9AGAR|nr:uncharacterized protein E1B28_005018 [Marasmius oreades]KAG7097693.1 hypothetical protein E1B28_005018 [Marasmius oreades]
MLLEGKLILFSLITRRQSRYRPFLRVARIHRHLSTKRRSGQSHGVDTHVPHRRPGCTALHCPACPEPGFNIDVDEIRDVKPEFRHTVTRFFAVDGCHSAQQLKKRDDPDDVALNGGSAYFVKREPFRAYASKQTGEPDNILKFKNAIVTGIVGMICTRHGFFYPSGMVDMDRGEGYHLVDWIIYQGFSMYPNLRWIFGSYDLWCIYIKNFIKRLRNNSEFFNNEETLKLLETVTGAIPQGHIDGHNDDCKAKYHFAYTRFVAMTIRELVETPWAVEKLTGGSTRHMNDGHRHDTLDDFHGFWNWQKYQKLGSALKSKWAKAVQMIAELQPTFDELSGSFEPTVIAEWEQLYIKPLPGPRDDIAEDLFVSRVDKNIPSLKTRISEQITKERVNVDSQSQQALDGVTDLILTGINLDRTRCKILRLASLSNPPKDKLKKMDAARTRFHKDSLAFSEMMSSYYPALVSLIQRHAKDLNLQHPERNTLPLPSSFNGHERNACGLSQAAAIECSLREGLAHDCLEDVRIRVLTYNHIVAVKKVEVTGQRQHTRAQGLLCTQMNGAKDACRLYNHNRQALIALGLDEHDQEIRALKETELWCRNTSKARHLGSSQPDPWYWSIGRRNINEDSDESEKWKVEMHRVKWFHDRAILDRWKEEKEILEAEYPRIVRAHAQMQEIWNMLADEHAQLARSLKVGVGNTSRQCMVLLGYESYAQKQAYVHEKLGFNVEREWQMKEKVKPSRRKWDKRVHSEDNEESKDDGNDEWETVNDFAYLDEEVLDEED